MTVGYCQEHEQVRGVSGARCRHCGNTLKASRLLFPVEHKHYQDGSMIEREWAAVQKYLCHAFMFTVFGYSAPVTDVEAKQLLKDAWGDIEDRRMEQTEIINRPGADHEELRELWSPFIHPHHYEIHESFYDSWISNHPRRTLEAYINQYMEAKFIEDNPVPPDLATVEDLVAWFEPLFEADRRYMDALTAEASEDTPPIELGYGLDNWRNGGRTNRGRSTDTNLAQVVMSTHKHGCSAGVRGRCSMPGAAPTAQHGPATRLRRAHTPVQ